MTKKTELNNDILIVKQRMGRKDEIPVAELYTYPPPVVSDIYYHRIVVNLQLLHFIKISQHLCGSDKLNVTKDREPSRTPKSLADSKVQINLLFVFFRLRAKVRVIDLRK